MIKGIVAAVALTGSLVVGPAALAAPVDPAGSLPGYGLEHAGHDHGAKPDKPKPKPKKPKHPDKKKGHGDSAHAGGGYDSHRSHPRNW
jgi:hypothetical protein